MLILLANLIAWPVSYYLMNQWLKDFAYRISINPIVFVLAAIVVFTIAVVTIIFQSVKAAAANPVKSLRYE